MKRSSRLKILCRASLTLSSKGTFFVVGVIKKRIIFKYLKLREVDGEGGYSILSFVLDSKYKGQRNFIPTLRLEEKKHPLYSMFPFQFDTRNAMLTQQTVDGPGGRGRNSRMRGVEMLVVSLMAVNF